MADRNAILSYFNPAISGWQFPIALVKLAVAIQYDKLNFMSNGEFSLQSSRNKTRYVTLSEMSKRP
jgi:hypothetical protein